MRKHLTNGLLTVLLSLALSTFLPWWSSMLSAFLISAIVRLQKAATFIVPFLAITLLWIGQAYWLSQPNDFTLTEKITVLLGIEGNVLLLFIITGLIGGVSAGFAGLLGNHTRQLIIPSK